MTIYPGPKFDINFPDGLKTTDKNFIRTNELLARLSAKNEARSICDNDALHGPSGIELSNDGNERCVMGRVALKANCGSPSKLCRKEETKGEKRKVDQCLKCKTIEAKVWQESAYGFP